MKPPLDSWDVYERFLEWLGIVLVLVLLGVYVLR